jgi:hypothetical protein
MTADDRDTPLEPDPKALHRRDQDASAGSGDSSALENVPSGEKQEAARQPQNAPPPERRGNRGR